MLGEADPDSVIAERLSGESPFMATDKLDLNEGVFFEDEPKARLSDTAAVVDVDSPVDTPVAVTRPVATPPPAAVATPPPAAAAAAPGAAPRSLDQVFRQMRDEAGRGSAEEAAAEQYGLATTYRDLGMIDDAIQALKTAAQSPRQRFDAAALLGALYLERDDTAQAIEWFEKAAEAPAPTPDAGRALLYDLADTLEKVGEPARALAVFSELEAESGAYRDVAGRVDRLSKARAKKG
jgi:tetratricopeptide (TPR) repeat protein